MNTTSSQPTTAALPSPLPSMPPLSDSKPNGLWFRSSTHHNNNTANANANANNNNNSSSSHRRLSYGFDKENVQQPLDLNSPKEAWSTHSRSSNVSLPVSKPPGGVMPQGTTTTSSADNDDDDSHPLDEVDDQMNIPKSTTSAATNNSSSSSAFSNGKMFWMNFLEQTQDSSSPLSEASGNHNRNSYISSKSNSYTPMGRMIQRTFTTESPLSDASTYNQQQAPSPAVSDWTAGSTPTGNSNSNSHNSKQKSPSELDQVFQKRIPTVTIPSKTVAPVEDITPPPVEPSEARAYPQSLAERVQVFQQQTKRKLQSQSSQHQVTHKSDVFPQRPQSSNGADDNDDDALHMLSPVQAARKRFEAQSQKSLAQQAKVKKPTTAHRSNAHDRDKQASTTNSRSKPSAISKVQESWTSANESTPSAADAVAPHLASPDQLIEIGSFPTSSSSSLTTGELVFPEGKTTKKPFLATANLKTPETAPPKMKSSTLPAAQTEDASRTETPVVSSSSSEGDFRDLLRAWRNKSEDKLNTRFRSPPQTNPPATTTKRPSTTSKLSAPSCSSATSIHVSPVPEKKDRISQKIQTFDKDHFDRVREKASIESRQSNQNSNPALKDEERIVRYVDSDAFEDSLLESNGEMNRALVILESNDTFQIMVGNSSSAYSTDKSTELRIRNVELITSTLPDSPINDCQQCGCSGSIFSGNDDLISFFLPQMGMACTCGKQKPRGFANPDDPTAVENVLRPWQVEFLKSFGIYRGEDLVKARHRSASILSRALRQWRRKQGMVAFKTSSCGMAIDIWAKTCKVYVRSIRKQIHAGQDWLERRPDEVMKELIQFAGDLPAAPKRREEFVASFDIEPESQMEV